MVSSTTKQSPRSRDVRSIRSSRSRARAIALSLVALIGTVTASSPAEPLRVLRSNPRYFTDGSGKAVYLTGSHVWMNLFSDFYFVPAPLSFDYSQYLDLLESHGQNFIRGWTTVVPQFDCGPGVTIVTSPFPWLRTGPGTASDGQPAFDLSQFDPAFFERLRERAIAARDRGIYISVMFFEGGTLQYCRIPESGYPFEGTNNINGIDAPGMSSHTLDYPEVTAIQDAFVREVINTVNDLDNVLFEICNETVGYSTEWQYHLLDVVKGHEASLPKQHPVGMTYQYEGGNNDVLFASSADWISPVGTWTDPFFADGSKVILYDTDHVDANTTDPDGVWKSFVRGHNPIVMDRTQDKNDGPQWEPIRTALGQARSYADKMNLAAMVPSGDVASTGYALVAPGAEYLVYQPDQAAFTVDLTASADLFDVEWFDTSAGSASAGDQVTGGATLEFAAPFAGPAVLYLRSTALPVDSPPAAPQNLTVR